MHPALSQVVERSGVRCDAERSGGHIPGIHGDNNNNSRCSNWGAMKIGLGRNVDDVLLGYEDALHSISSI